MLQEHPQPSNSNEHLKEEIPTCHHALGLGGQLPFPSSWRREYLNFDPRSTQLRSVNRHLDEVQREFIKSKKELREGSSVESPFVHDIQDNPIPLYFRLPTLEAYDGSSDPTEHIVAFQTHMALYSSSDTLMC
ncbi:hypothetical protein B296_00012278 [Ensete ventricosum]|uniref:Uncharacterized protein n=1 Tax=Ensete ventricosum TaxID=4639 RepID=A0A426ZGC6_ENSVE|nr:hypothetical protein B296_00012278 [Ensete ventricosum]